MRQGLDALPEKDRGLPSRRCWINIDPGPHGGRALWRDWGAPLPLHSSQYSLGIAATCAKSASWKNIWRNRKVAKLDHMGRESAARNETTYTTTTAVVELSHSSTRKRRSAAIINRRSTDGLSCSQDRMASDARTLVCHARRDPASAIPTARNFICARSRTWVRGGCRLPVRDLVRDRVRVQFPAKPVI